MFRTWQYLLFLDKQQKDATLRRPGVDLLRHKYLHMKVICAHTNMRMATGNEELKPRKSGLKIEILESCKYIQIVFNIMGV